MRRLYIIPIIHSRHDLGSLEQPVYEQKRRQLSEAAIESSRVAVDAFWFGLQNGIASWNLDYANAVVFQDALPFTGHPDRIIEHKIVEELAAKGSANHKLVKWLIDQGARLEGTESSELLLKEYEAVRKALANGLAAYDEPSTDRSSGHTLLIQRDRFIANRISESLCGVQKFGLLFLGMLHRVEDYLTQDIQVEYPFGRLKSDAALQQH